MESKDTWKAEFDEFETVTRQFYNKEISVKDYKGFSGGFGSYAQRGGEASMLRLRMAGGRLTKDKLSFIVDSIKKFHIDKVHFTTCQTVQLHNLSADAVVSIAREALDHGINTRGGGGDFPRNVMVSPLSGTEKGEYFDVTPYSQAAADYLMGFIKTVKLPRKLKVAFSNSHANQTHATFRDLGFVATPEGKFDVYSAGGLGNNPKMGLLVAAGVEPSKILYYIKAMVDTFMTYGNYENRAKARTRYMQDVLGKEGYVKAYQEKLDQVFASGAHLDLDVSPSPAAKKSDGSTASGPRVIPQKQEGLYTVAYHPVGGSPDPGKLAQIYDTIKDMEAVELRLSPDESVYIINLTGDEAKQVLAVTEDGANTLFSSSVACIGASICQVGVRDSQALLARLVEMEKSCGFSDGILPRIHISGCPSSCGTHQIGEIGFHGGVKLIDKQPTPAFTLHINGSDVQGQEQFGEQLGMILEADIPAFLEEVGRTVEKAGTDYKAWIPSHREELKAIAAKYLV